MKLGPGASAQAESGEGAQTFAEPRWLVLVAAASVFLVAFAWLPAASAPYHYDDFNTPVGDAALQSLGSWWRLLPETLRPLTKLTYALESSLGAVTAPSRRVLNAALFAGCVMALKRLLQALRLPPAVALLVACGWAVHPVHAETVVALAGRPVLLATLLLLTSALWLVQGRVGAALVAAVLALLARESSLPWLVACVGLAVYQRGGRGTRLFLAGLIGLGAGVVLLGSSRGLRELVASIFRATDAYNRLGLQWAALSKGTWALFMEPAGFTPDMDFAPSGGTRLTLILCTFVLYGGALWVSWRVPRLRVLALLWLCFVLPTHSFAPKLDVLTARPFSASLAPLLALSTCALWPRLARNPSLFGGFVLTFAAAMAGAFGLTRKRAELYREPVALWRDAAERSVQKTRPLVNLGTLLAQEGKLSEARAALEQALTRDPGNMDIRLRLHAVERAMVSRSSLPATSSETRPTP